MRIFAVAAGLDINGWLRGMFSAGIQGGASAVSGGALVSMLAPDQFNLQKGKFYVLMGGLFIANGTVSIMRFLSQHPLPDEKTVTTSVAVTQQPGAAPTTVATITETHTEKK